MERAPRIDAVTPAAAVCAVYVIGLAGAEVLLLTSGIAAGAVAHVALVLVLLLHATAVPDSPYRRMLMVLVLPSLIRLLGLTIPVAATPVAVWYLTAGTPALLGALLVARVTALPRSLYGRPASLPLQLLVGLTGITSGLLAYLVLRPQPVSTDLPVLVISGVAVAVFAAVTEELVFRGSLQSVAADLFGSSAAGVGMSTGLFALMYIGSQSVPFVLLMLATGLFLAWAVQQTGSLWGPMLAHAAMVVGLVVIWPVLLP